MERRGDQTELTDEADETDGVFDAAADRERQKRKDLLRALARSVARPIKKELRHSRVEGRYIRPEEIDKEVAKLERAKREAAEKKKGFFGRLFSRKKPPAPEPEKEEKRPDAPPPTPQERAEKKKRATMIQRLRGISVSYDAEPRDDARRQTDAAMKSERHFETIPEEKAARRHSFSFAAAAQKLAGRSAAPQSAPEPASAPPPFVPEYAGMYAPAPQSFAPAPVQFAPWPPQNFAGQFQYPVQTQPAPQPITPVPAAAQPLPQFAPVAGMPDGTIATALSAAVGFVYWDEDGRQVDRIITVRRLIAKDGDILIDAYCPDINAPRMIPFSKGVKLYSLRTMAACDDPRDFLLHRIAGLPDDRRFDDDGFAAVLSVVRYELAALAFAARADFDQSDVSKRLMLEYVSHRCPTIDFDEREMLDYISMLVPDEQSFFEAIEVVTGQPREIVYPFVRTFLKMLLSDGVLHENESELLAELLYLLEIRGMDLNRLGLE